MGHGRSELGVLNMRFIAFKLAVANSTGCRWCKSEPHCKVEIDEPLVRKNKGKILSVRSEIDTRQKLKPVTAPIPGL
jgi:hypothetical protein